MKSSLLFQEADEVKTFIEKNKTLPKTCTINGNEYTIYTTSYLFGELLANITKSDITVKNIKYPTTEYKGTINENIKPADYRQMNQNFIRYCKENNRVPAYITTQKSKTKVPYDLFVYCLCKILVFYHKNSNTLPAYCTFNSSNLQSAGSGTTSTKKTTKTSTSTQKKTTTKKKSKCENPYTSSPHYHEQGCNKLGQCTGYWCGPHSIHQALKKFGITKYSEKQIAAFCGTTTAGTDHNGINTAIAKISKETGIKLTVQWKNFSDLGKTKEERFAALAKLICKDNIAVFGHIGYANAGSKAVTSGSKVFGHYEGFDKINTRTKFIRALNSLGDKLSSGAYKGHLQDRSYTIQASYFANTPGGQKALCIITKG